MIFGLISVPICQRSDETGGFPWSTHLSPWIKVCFRRESIPFLVNIPNDGLIGSDDVTQVNESYTACKCERNTVSRPLERRSVKNKRPNGFEERRSAPQFDVVRQSPMNDLINVEVEVSD